ncbi:MAG: hypothetical protein ACP5L5_11515 [Vulcanisaeta sp.]|uniref:hypothetical protein n=1 Tax=Vulcanisaeta sp. TaxID=2020871 RepID=UPI003D0BD82E
MVVKKLRVALLITLVFLTVLAITLTKVATAQNSCSTPIGNCNYEVTTNGITPSYVAAYAYITNTMTVQSYNGLWMVLLLYNPDYSMVCYNPVVGSTGYWVQGVIFYGLVSGYPGGPGSTGNLYLSAWIVSCLTEQLVWNNTPSDFSQPTATNVPWPLVSGAHWYIIYYVGSNGLISQIYEEVYVPTNGKFYTLFINIQSQYTNRWYRSNVNWGGGANGGSVTFNSGGSGQIYYCSNVNLYQGSLAQNAGESSNVAYTQMYDQGTTCSMYQDFQT